jgi:hypothetical protein
MFVIVWQEKIGAKAARKMLVKFNNTFKRALTDKP